MKICDMCDGSRNILGMGNIQRKCEKCSGVGYISDKSVLADKPIKDKEEIISSSNPAKKRGRPKIDKTK